MSVLEVTTLNKQLKEEIKILEHENTMLRKERDRYKKEAYEFKLLLSEKLKGENK